MYQIVIPVHCGNCHEVDHYMDEWVENECVRKCLACGHKKVMATVTTSASIEMVDGNPGGGFTIKAEPLPKVEIF